MIIYNVTSNIEKEVINHWLEWMQTVHIPAMLSTGKFFNARMVKVLIEDPTGAATYSVQYYTNSKAILDRYYKEDAERLRNEVVRVFADKVLHFRTELEIISEH